MKKSTFATSLLVLVVIAVEVFKRDAAYLMRLGAKSEGAVFLLTMQPSLYAIALISFVITIVLWFQHANSLFVRGLVTLQQIIAVMMAGACLIAGAALELDLHLVQVGKISKLQAPQQRRVRLVAATPRPTAHRYTRPTTLL